MSQRKESDRFEIKDNFYVLLQIFYIKDKKRNSPVETRVISSIHYDTYLEDEETTVANRIYYTTKYNKKRDKYLVEKDHQEFEEESIHNTALETIIEDEETNIITLPENYKHVSNKVLVFR